MDEAVLCPRVGGKVGIPACQRLSSAFAEVDLGRVAYAATWVSSTQDQSVLLDAPDMIARLGAADRELEAFRNGVTIGRFGFVRELVLDSDPMKDLALRQGWNPQVAKLHNPSGPWRLAARWMPAAGAPAGDLQCSTTPPDGWRSKPVRNLE